VEIVAGLAARMLPAGRFDWSRMTDHDTLRRGIAAAVPGWSAVADIGRTKKEFTIEGRVRHTPEFPLPGGRARACDSCRRTCRPTAS
jgi:hypothetical protein